MQKKAAYTYGRIGVIVKHNGLSIAGFVVSLVSLVIFGLYGLSGTVGLILSCLGRSEAVKNGDKTGLAVAGIVLGIISIIGGVMTLFIYNMY